MLSFVLEVPLSTKNFLFGSKGHCLKMMPKTKKAQFEQDILVMFLNAKKAWEAKDEDDEDIEEQYDRTQSYGLIPCNTNNSSKRKMKVTASSSSATTTKGKRYIRTIDTAKLDFFLFRSFNDEDFVLQCVEVKKPGRVVTQSLSNRSKLALEMKRSIDHQAVLGVQSPKCFDILVDGLVVASFAAQLDNCGIYSILELEEFSLLHGKSDLTVLPDFVLYFCWLKKLMDEDAATMAKRRRTIFGSSRLLRPAVAFPAQKSNR
ncbi:hypothetical protein EDC96DRAFT_561804, partial [Choanephora cucurbitarum]